ncbi:LysR family transcriptional regulator [Xylocopilactobacillus apicola]|uniref:LysR family transcriptional regulator n=1 Tax=Xylocopilactobacillus apicola TaxID=2932184 RepID=A0AAU9D2V4_9LACO|nr:LysR family transcriptional regulator [Xylocopilactobacillus apicola]BDR59136.1 LysR family transcriptional regulator [Xylocopilactobacillus apicola]
MEFRVLQYFLAVAEEKNISRAAEKLHVTQPNVSRQLRDLETELGTTLFERGSHQIELTSDGLYLANQARQILALVNKTEDNLQNLAEISGSLTIGSGESPTMMTIVENIKALQENYPNVKVNLVSTNADVVQKNLQTGIFDFGVVMEPTDKRKFDFLTLPGVDEWGLLLRKDHQLAQRKFIEPRDFHQLDLIISQQSGVENFLKNWLGTSIAQYKIVASYNLLYNASLLVEARLGAALAFNGIINNTELKFVPLNPPQTAHCSLIWQRGTTLSPAGKIFLKMVKQFCAETSK